MTHQVTLLLLLISLWMHLHQAALITIFSIPESYLFYQTSKPSTLSLVAWTAAGIIADKPCNPRKYSLTGFIHYILKVWWSRNSIIYLVYNSIISDTNIFQEIGYYQSTSKRDCLWWGFGNNCLVHIIKSTAAIKGGRLLITFSLDNWAPALINGWFSANILLTSENSVFNAQMVDFIS